MEYEINSVNNAWVWALGYKNGRSHFYLGSSGSPVLSGLGLATRSFVPIDRDTDISYWDIDQIYVRMRERTADGSYGEVLVEGYIDIVYSWSK